MKKLLLSTAMAVSTTFAFGQAADVINGDFEDWDDREISNPSELFDANEQLTDQGLILDKMPIDKSSDAAEGSYSIHMETVLTDDGDTTFGYWILGDWGDDGPEGGAPFTLAADSIKGKVKYDIMAGDTAWFVVQLKSAGAIVGGGSYSITGSSSSWTDFAWALNTSSSVVDTLFIACVNSNVISDNETAVPGSWMKVDDIWFTKTDGSSDTFENSDFEDWDSEWVSTVEDWEFFGWETNKIGDATSDSYAIELRTIEFEHGDGSTEIMEGLLANYDVEYETGGTHFTAMPSMFSGSWDYSPSVTGEDTAWIQIEFFKSGSSLGTYHALAADTTGGYVDFDIAISLSENPDTFRIIAYAGDSVGSILKLDDLTLASDYSTTEVSLDGGVYPNPTSGVVNVSTGVTYIISNAIGVDVASGAVSNGVVSLSDLDAGVYVLTLYDGSGNAISSSRVVKQ